jgi:hypothetical protein
MQDIQDSRWVFTRHELWQLLGHFAPALLLGVADPYFGCEAEQIASAKLKAVSSLQRKGLTSFCPGASSPLGAALEILAHPAYSLILTSQFAVGAQSRRFLHFRGFQILEHSDIDPQHQQLILIPGRGALVDRCAHDLRMDSLLPAAESPIIVDEAVSFDANKACRDENPAEAGRILAAGNVAPDAAAIILQTLSAPVANASVTLVRISGEAPLFSGWGILEGGGLIWMLRPFQREGRRCTEWIPAGPGAVRAAFERILS